MERTVSMHDILVEHNPRLRYELANPFDYYLFNTFLRGIYVPTPRPELLLVNLMRNDVEAVINFHESHYLMYESDINLFDVPYGINIKMLFANLNRDITRSEIPFEVMGHMDRLDMVLINAPVITEYTKSDWLAIYLFGLCSLKGGGIMMTLLQDIDIPGYHIMKNLLRTLTGSVPVLEEDTPFTLDEIIGHTYYRVSIYKKVEKWKHQSKNFSLGLSPN